ncbi:ATP-dependent nuclease [Photobacterium damselae]
MREARVSDYWSRVGRFRDFSNVITNITLSTAGRYSESSIDINSAITTICGRNGLGKTTLLKIFYSALSKDSNFHIPNTIEDEIHSVTFNLKRNGQALSILGSDDKALPNVEYFDGSHFLHSINRECVDSPSKNGWINGGTKIEIPQSELNIIKLITGKKYENFDVWEIGHIIEDTIFPFFMVSLDGHEYSNESMGQGEHKLLLLWWKMFSAKNNSFLLIEEPEAYVCPSSQNKMMDMIAYHASKKKINIIMTTHSEHVLNKQNIGSINILKRKGRDKYEVVPASNNTRYLSALGLSSEYQQLLFVEDEFAKLMLENILKIFDEYSYKISLIQNLCGESNIQMLTKHYRGANHFKYIAVYDADQRGVVENFTPYIKKVFLPSGSNFAPEIDVINCVLENVEAFSSKININTDLLYEKISELVCDHHDWFKELSKLIDKNTEGLKYEAINLWIELNNDICKYFIFELNNIHNDFLVTVVNNDGEKKLQTKCGLLYKSIGPAIVGSEEGQVLTGKIVYSNKLSMIEAR